ncbi:MAG: hypothetical protein F4Y44_01450 [Chloroflexi bacterium]|nr:hypothetical protein [Chloroflexota bacterium]
MTDRKLQTTLLPIVQEHGLGSVLEALGKIASEQDAQSESSLAVNGAGEATKTKKPRKRSTKPDAVEYAANMELPSDKRDAIVALAERFERKDFLPTFGDIRNFCDLHGIDVPASNTRASAIPRVFKFLANEMEADEVQRILNYELFSGPSRLGPIVDAIRRNGRASRTSRFAK